MRSLKWPQNPEKNTMRRNRQQSKDLNIGTSIVTLPSSSFFKHRIEKYRMDTTALQEIRWFGYWFIVNKRIQLSVTWFKPGRNRICYIRIGTNFRYLWIFSVYAPTENKSEEKKVESYSLLKNTRKWHLTNCWRILPIHNSHWWWWCN